MKYKALTVLQPWAYLLCKGYKQIETRSRNTTHRGLLLIHASAAMAGGRYLRNMSSIEKWHFEQRLPTDTILRSHTTEILWGELNYGAIIGAVELMATCPTIRVMTRSADQVILHQGSSTKKLHVDEGAIRLTPEEAVFGDYSLGRYGWRVEGPIMFDEPIPAKGKLGLWTPDEATSELVTAAIATAKEGQQG